MFSFTLPLVFISSAVYQSSGRSIQTLIHPDHIDTGHQFINGSCLGGSCTPNKTHTGHQFINDSCLGGSCTPNMTHTGHQFINDYPNQNASCPMCILLTGLVEIDINLTNSSIQDVSDLVLYVCSHLDGNSSDYCMFFNRTLLNVTHLISYQQNISQICRNISMC